jgi:putative copper resistance protein D
VIELAIILVRWVQYGGAAILFGLPLFFACVVSGTPPAGFEHRARRVLAIAAMVLAFSSLLSIGLQASLFSGSFTEGFQGPALAAVVSFMALGKAALVRAMAAVIAFTLFVAVRPARTMWWAGAILGAIAAITLGWMGHGAATEGGGHTWHLMADILHSLAASVWIGSLLGFVLLLFGPAASGEAMVGLHGALARFATLGTLLVVTLAATGLINGWFMVGPEKFAALWSTPYGQLLLVKLVLFAAMLGLAAANRFRLTPRLGASLGGSGVEPAVADLRRSVAWEMSLGFGVLALVAWLGTLVPPTA